jgi:hypothetical protein
MVISLLINKSVLQPVAGCQAENREFVCDRFRGQAQFFRVFFNRNELKQNKSGAEGGRKEVNSFQQGQNQGEEAASRS